MCPSSQGELWNSGALGSAHSVGQSRGMRSRPARRHWTHSRGSAGHGFCPVTENCIGIVRRSFIMRGLIQQHPLYITGGGTGFWKELGPQLSSHAASSTGVVRKASVSTLEGSLAAIVVLGCGRSSIGTCVVSWSDATLEMRGEFPGTTISLLSCMLGAACIGASVDAPL